MSRLQSLKLFVNQRLNAAVEEIFGHFERTITEYEEELERRHRKLLDVVLTPEIKLRHAVIPADVQLLLVRKEEVPPEQQVCGSGVGQEEPEPPHIKEEQEELWTGQEGEQLQGLEEADITRVTVKSEDDEEVRHPPERKTDDSINQTKPSERSHQRNNTGENSPTCSECGKTFSCKSSLNLHKRTHTGVKPFSCSECNKRFYFKGKLENHMRVHAGEKLFSCQVCGKKFSEKGTVTRHMRTHTGEKPFSCTVCGKRFAQKVAVTTHMRTHTGEKPFSCSFCFKRFTEKASMTTHMRIHTGEKPYNCRVCDKKFNRKFQIKTHKCSGEKNCSK
ncbi:uncharacterized protein ACBR49_017363 [Aulostomus maculatus]